MAHVIILLLALVGSVWGFRKGFVRQTPGIIGVAFGIVSTRILSAPMIDILYGALPSAHGSVGEAFVYSAIANAIVFTGVYVVFATVTSFLSRLLKRDDRTILDNIFGGVFALFKYMLFASVALNFLVGINTGSSLMKNVKSDDGNIVEETMLLAPAILGGPDVDDLSHLQQLEEAKKIS